MGLGDPTLGDPTLTLAGHPCHARTGVRGPIAAGVCVQVQCGP